MFFISKNSIETYTLFDKEILTKINYELDKRAKSEKDYSNNNYFI